MSHLCRPELSLDQILVECLNFRPTMVQLKETKWSRLYAVQANICWCYFGTCTASQKLFFHWNPGGGGPGHFFVIETLEVEVTSKKTPGPLEHTGRVGTDAHSRMGHYFFSYLLTWEVDLIEILKIMPQMWQYVIFLSLKPTKVTSDFILNSLKRVVGGAIIQKYQKQILKPWYIQYWSAPQESLGCQKMRQGPLNTPFEIWCANIASKLKNIWNTLRKQDFFDIFFQFLTIFRSLCLFWAILAQKLNSFIYKKKFWFFDTPGTPGSVSI
jgi:hypothetical protein